MTFQPNDIIKDGDYYRLVHSMLGDVMLAGLHWESIKDAKQEKHVFAFHPSDYANWTIVERDGKPYVPERWFPKRGEAYYSPDPTQPKRYQAVREAVAKAVPEVRRLATGSDPDAPIYYLRPVQLADVLRAIPKGWHIAVENNGYFYNVVSECYYGPKDSDAPLAWNLAVPLDQQPPDVIDFLFRVLCE